MAMKPDVHAAETGLEICKHVVPALTVSVPPLIATCVIMVLSAEGLAACAGRGGKTLAKDINEISAYALDVTIMMPPLNDDQTSDL